MPTTTYSINTCDTYDSSSSCEKLPYCSWKSSTQQCHNMFLSVDTTVLSNEGYRKTSALLDTGSPYTVLGNGLCDQIGLQESTIPKKKLQEGIANRIFIKRQCDDLQPEQWFPLNSTTVLYHI